MKTAPLDVYVGSLMADFRHSLSDPAASLVEATLAEARRLDASLYLVGGPVRDLLLHRPSADLDLVTEGDVELLARGIAKAVGSKAVVHRRFGTATIEWDGQRLDMATARKESYARPGALPSVSPGTIEEDLWRRDFTVNAMALGLSGWREGKLLDPCDGMTDLSCGVVRILHPVSFEDDPTRIFRAVRYEQRLGFSLEAGTLHKLRDALDSGALATVSADRLRREVALILEDERPVHTLLRAGELGVLCSLYTPLRQVDWLRKYGNDQQPQESLELVAALAYPMSFEEGQAFIARLNMPSEWADAVAGMTRLARVAPSLEAPNLAPSALFQSLENVPLASIRAFKSLTESSLLKQRLSHFLENQRFVRPALRGGDLVALGVPEGPRVGEMLRAILYARLEGKVTTRQDERELVARCLRH